MADYLNPDSMLTPTNAKESMYAPSYDQMLWADTTRRLQAEEMLKHKNELNAYEAVEQKHKLPVFMAEQQQKLLEAQAKSNPDYIAAMRRGETGTANTNYAKGEVDLAGIENQIAGANAAHGLQMGNIDFMQDYVKKENIARTLTGLMGMYPAGAAREQKVADYIRSVVSPKSGWLVPENMDRLKEYAKNPESMLKILNDELDAMRTQEQRFKWNLDGRELASREKIAGMENTTRQAIGRSETKKEAQIVYEDFMATDPKFRALSPDARWRRVYEAMSYKTPASQPLETREGWVKITQPDGSVRWEKVTTKETEKSATSTPTTTTPAKANVICAPGFVYDPTKDACVKGK